MPSFRFLHAADIQLERTVSGIPELPAALETRLCDFSYQAAERVFDAALTESVDFLVLAGNILDPLRTGPRGPIFLIRQFERLAEAGIDVYWAGGDLDSPEDWPTGFALPGNVHLFPSSGIQEYTIIRDNTPVARLVGMSRNRQHPKLRTSELLPDDALFTIVVANGQVDPESLAARRIPYWALGGRSRHTFVGNRRKVHLPVTEPEHGTVPPKTKKGEPIPYIVHYPGPPVGRSPKESGIFGATLVEVLPNEEPTLTLIPAAPIRWLDMTVSLTPEDDAETLLGTIREQIKTHRAAQDGYDLMIRWKIDAAGANPSLLRQIRPHRFSEDLLAELRGLYGKEEPIAWSLSIEIVEPNRLPTGGSQKTILSDYLRLARHHLQHPGEPLDLESMLPETLRDQPIAKRLLLHTRRSPKRHEEPEPPLETAEEATESPFVQSPAQRRAQSQALREAVRLGIELLGGEKRRPESLLDDRETGDQ